MYCVTVYMLGTVHVDRWFLNIVADPGHLLKIRDPPFHVDVDQGSPLDLITSTKARENILKLVGKLAKAEIEIDVSL